MNSSFQNQNNNAKNYYPEAIDFNSQHEAFKSSNAEQENSTSSQQFQNPFSALFNQNLSNIFGNNDLLTSMLAGNFLNKNNRDSQNNILMQALSSMINSSSKEKENKKESDEKVEKVIEIESSFEDI